MFVPGVNGSVIPSVSSGSKLKGAYKNSKKRKMPNGGLTYTPYSPAQNRYTDSPVQKPIVKPRVGDTISPNYERLYTDLGVDLGSYIPGPVGRGFNAVSVIRSADNNSYNQGLDLMPGKKANTISVVNDIYNISNAKPYKYQGRKLKDGGEVETEDEDESEDESEDDKEMVDGVASILRGVKSKANRLQLANKLAKQFNREKVNYDLKSFLKKSNVKK
jgi:hypothetical protein